MRRLALMVAAVVGGSCSKPAAREVERQGQLVTLLATAEVRGTPEPCGCQAEPLGDVARVASLLAEAKRKGGALLVDAGGLRYSAEPIKKGEEAQAHAKARFLEGAWRQLGTLVALGDEDLRLPPTDQEGRLAANLGGRPGVLPHAVREVGGLRIGVFGIVDPTLVEGATEMIEAAKREVEQLSGERVQVIVALAHTGRAEARRIARAVSEISILVVGHEVDEGGEAEQVGSTILVQPAAMAQKVAMIELHLEAGRVSTKLTDTPEARREKAARLEGRVAAQEKTVAALRGDTSADPAFLKTQENRLAALRAELAELRAPTRPPTPPYAVATLVPVRRAIPRDPKIAAAMKQLDAEVGEANRRAGEKVPVPRAARGEARYVGTGECLACHDEAVEEWETTVHAKAWEELERVNKQWSFDCIGCHVTGYGRPGGSAMAHVDKLTDVQCEVCHGPGSKHIDKPRKARLAMPSESDCRACHTKEHSDTFAFAPYLRDILGKGHGAKRRAALGEGPTAHELRQAARAAAK